MKIWYVYEIVNLMGTVEYVGESINPKRRFYNHKVNSKTSGNGRFYKRSDVFLNVVKQFDNRIDAFNYQCELQKEYGLPTDLETKYPKHLKICIEAWDKSGNYVGEWGSLSEASYALNIKIPAISYVINKQRKHAKGYTFSKKVVKD